MVTAAGTAQLGLTLATSAAAAAGIAYAAHEHLRVSATLPALWQGCNWPTGHHSSSSGSGTNPYAIIDSSLCLALPLYRLTRTDLLSVGAFSLALSGLLPLFAFYSYTAISPNARASFLSTGLTLFAAASHFLGAGFLAAGPVVLLYALGTALFFAKRASLTPLPTRPLGAHLVNILLSVYLFAGLGIMFLNPQGAKWYNCFLALLLVPLALLNLPTIAAGQRTPQSEADVRKALSTFSAGELSAAFERTWASYRRIGLVSGILYWYGIGRITNALLFRRATSINDATFHSLLSFAGTSVALLALVAIDRLTARARASDITTQPLPNTPANTKTVLSQVTEQTPRAHPLTGKQPSKLDLECERAIARAPAGHPIVELGIKGTTIATLLGGPGLAAAFWWARGEEEAGWKARREWREIQALASKKQ
ncbi:hypothetical protein OC842_001852 [Tilletia horrida]|uniref:Uncharacterized protein n=1 Tax=Tilletia horrida TaxID=155126 RepID=A0AAN6GJ59_9BASI|nr:hypothetical protein OC842_001852 [Tilletia horrida]